MDKLFQKHDKPVIAERKNNMVRTREECTKEQECVKTDPQIRKVGAEGNNVQRLKLKDYIHLHELQKSKSKAKSRSKMNKNQNIDSTKQLLKPPTVTVSKIKTDQPIKKVVNSTKEQQELIKTEILRSFVFQKQKINEIEKFFTQKFQISNSQSNIVFMFKILENVRNINESIQLMANHIKRIPPKPIDNETSQALNKTNDSYSFKNIAQANADKNQKSKNDRKGQLKNSQNSNPSKSHLALTFNPGSTNNYKKVKNDHA